MGGKKQHHASSTENKRWLHKDLQTKEGIREVQLGMIPLREPGITEQGHRTHFQAPRPKGQNTQSDSEKHPGRTHIYCFYKQEVPLDGL